MITSQDISKEEESLLSVTKWAEFPDESPEAIELRHFKEFIDTEWGPPAVNQVLRSLWETGFAFMPRPSSWNIPGDLDIERLLWEQVQTDKFIEASWPAIKLMIGPDTSNRQWAAQLLTILGLFNLLEVLPIVLKGE